MNILVLNENSSKACCRRTANSMHAIASLPRPGIRHSSIIPFAKADPALMLGAADCRNGKRANECPFGDRLRQQAWRRGREMQRKNEGRRGSNHGMG